MRECIICGKKYTGTFGLGPCENGHTIFEEIAFAERGVKKYARKL